MGSGALASLFSCLVLIFNIRDFMKENGRGAYQHYVFLAISAFIGAFLLEVVIMFTEPFDPP
jgi:hypothetical protein